MQTFTNLPKWVERGRQVRNGEWISGMKINDTTSILNGSPRMHPKNYLSRNLRQSTNFSSGSSCTQIAWGSLFLVCNSTLLDRDFGVNFDDRNGNDVGRDGNASDEGDGDNDDGRRRRALCLDDTV